MYKNYKEDLVKYYQSLKENGSLAPRLVNPTPTSIKEECISVFEYRNSRKELPALLTFFRITDEAELKRAINKCDRDRFRPLANFLVGKTIDTEDPNINLLAWLIDFQRPYTLEFYQQKGRELMDHKKVVERGMGKNNADNGNIGEKEPDENKADEGEIAVRRGEIIDNHEKNKPSKKRITVVLIAVITLAVAAVFRHSLSDLFIGNKERCMIWTGDRFVPAKCGTTNGDTIAIPFNEERLYNFKRILRPDADTITYYSIGKLFYFLRNGQVEIYTGEGKHPVYQNRYLKPITSTIIDKYVSPK
jgi:hypothetical protein